MFLEKYLSEVKFNLLLDTYEEFYLNDLDEEKFLEIYNLFKKYNFYFFDDIILNYLEIFFMNKEEVENKLLELKAKLGDKFNYKIGNDMRYLESIFN